MNVNELYIYLKTLAPLAPLSPDQYNQILIMATNEMIEEIYGAIYKQQRGQLLIAYERTQSIQDALRFVEKEEFYIANGSGIYELPEDYRHSRTVSIFIKGEERAATTLERDKWATALKSKLVPPIEEPICNFEGSTFRVAPYGYDTKLYYISIPVYPFRNYTPSGAYDIYEPNGSVQPPFPEFLDTIFIRYMIRILAQSNEEWRNVDLSTVELKNMG